MIDPNATAQTAAAVSQAQAAWAQVWVGAISAAATFAAVLVALASPWLARFRRVRFEREVLFTATAALVRLSLTMETHLVSMSPGAALSVIRVARKRLELVLPVVDEYPMLTCLLALAPMLQQTEEQLEHWAAWMPGTGVVAPFSVDGFRAGARQQAEKAHAVIEGLGSARLVRRLKSVQPFGPSGFNATTP